MADTSDSGSEDEVGENEESFANPPFMRFSGTQTLRNYVENLELVFGDGEEFSYVKDWGKAEQAYSSCIKLCEGVGKQMEGDSECNRRYNRTLMLAFSNRAEARLQLHHYEKAFGDAGMALSIEPKHVISLVRKGKACHALGLFEQACEVLKVASEESPDNPAILKSLMISTIALEQDKRDIGSEDEGREDEVREDEEGIERPYLLEASPEDLRNYVKLLETIRREGKEIFSSKNWREAEDCYSLCINLSMFGDGQELDNDNKYHRRFNRTLTLAYTNRAETRLRLLHYEKALSDTERALAIEPKHLKTLVRKGKAAHALAFFDKACEAFKLASQESPNDQSIRRSLRNSTIAYEQSRAGKYDLTYYFMNGCTGEIPRCEDFVGPVEIRQNPDVRRGRGLFATKSLEPGELLLVSNPVAVVREMSITMIEQRESSIN
ncbi:unnamed protein product [Calypogeia fissa]